MSLPHREGRRYRAIGDVIDTVFPEARGIAETALDFVGQNGRGNEVGAPSWPCLAHRQYRSQIVARWAVLAQVGIIEVEIADEQAIHEGGPLNARLPAAKIDAPGLLEIRVPLLRRGCRRLRTDRPHGRGE